MPSSSPPTDLPHLKSTQEEPLAVLRLVEVKVAARSKPRATIRRAGPCPSRPVLRLCSYSHPHLSRYPQDLQNCWGLATYANLP